MTGYSKIAIVLFIFSLILWGASYMSYEQDLYMLTRLISYVWLISTIVLCLVNNINFIKNDKPILNLMNWGLSILILVLYYQYMKGETYSFNSLPSFAYIASLIAIIQEFGQTEDSNLNSQQQVRQPLNNPIHAQDFQNHQNFPKTSVSSHNNLNHNVPNHLCTRQLLQKL